RRGNRNVGQRGQVLRREAGLTWSSPGYSIGFVPREAAACRRIPFAAAAWPGLSEVKSATDLSQASPHFTLLNTGLRLLTSAQVAPGHCAPARLNFPLKDYDH